MKLFNEQHELPGGVHPSGLVVLAIIFLLVYWVLSHRQVSIGTSFTDEDMGAGGGIRPFGWTGENFIADDDPSDHERHFQYVMFGREPNYHQPVVVQQGKETQWYKWIDMTTYGQKFKPFLKKRSFPG